MDLNEVRRSVLLLVMLCITVTLTACAGRMTNDEMFPRRNPSSSVGLLRNEGTTHLNVWIYDEAGRLVEEMYLKPAMKPISSLAINQEKVPLTVKKEFLQGAHRVEYIPFYFIWTVFGGKQRVDLPRGSASIVVGRDPNAIYDQRTGRHWGWVLNLNGGDAPASTYLQPVQVQINCCTR